MKVTSQNRELSENNFLNPGFTPPYLCKEYLQKHPVSNLAYLASGLVATALAAFENDASGTPMDQRGINQTLFVAGAMLGDLIEEAEALEGAAVR